MIFRQKYETSLKPAQINPIILLKCGTTRTHLNPPEHTRTHRNPPETNPNPPKLTLIYNPNPPQPTRTQPETTRNHPETTQTQPKSTRTQPETTRNRLESTRAHPMQDYCFGFYVVCAKTQTFLR